MDNLDLRLKLTKESKVDKNSFLARDMTIEGVNWTFNGLETAEKTTFELPNVHFEWVEGDALENKKLKEN